MKSKGEKKIELIQVKTTQIIKKVQLNNYEDFSKLPKEPKHQIFIQKVIPKIIPSFDF